MPSLRSCRCPLTALGNAVSRAVSDREPRSAVPVADRRILSVVATHTLPAIGPRWLKLACVAFRELRWQGLQTWFGSFLAA
jgi:hypothetical protein